MVVAAVVVWAGCLPVCFDSVVAAAVACFLAGHPVAYCRVFVVYCLLLVAWCHPVVFASALSVVAADSFSCPPYPKFSDLFALPGQHIQVLFLLVLKWPLLPAPALQEKRPVD